MWTPSFVSQYLLTFPWAELFQIFVQNPTRDPWEQVSRDERNHRLRILWKQVLSAVESGYSIWRDSG